MVPDPVATARGSVFVDLRLQTFCLRGLGVVLAPTWYQRQTNIESKQDHQIRGCVANSRYNTSYELGWNMMVQIVESRVIAKIDRDRYSLNVGSGIRSVG